MKRALVTGGSGAIGRAICERLAHDGLHVVVHANTRREEAVGIARAIVDAGGSAEAVAFDLLDGDACAAACERLVEAGPIQVLVHSAGVHDDAAFAGMRRDQWHRVLDVSLDGFFHVTQPLLLPMIRTRWGRIVVLSSVTALAGNRGQVNYAAAKGGLNAAARSLALEVASRGIAVNAVAPGIIESPMASGAFDAEAIRRLVPMQRAGRPEEVAALCAFLVSDEAGYLTGQVVSLNGGLA